MANGIFRGNTPISSNADDSLCRLCGQETICDHLGVIRYNVPTDDPRFGKLFRCPNNVAVDAERQEKLRKLSNLDAFVDKTFATFQTDLQMISPQERQSLEIAYNTTLSFAEEPEGWLLLEGTYGCGKTHLAAAAGNARLKYGEVVIFVTAPDLLDHLRSAYGPSSETGYDETFERIRNARLLILDDLGVENPSPWAHEKLFQLLNHRYSYHLPTIITTNVPIDRLDARIRSRILHADLTRRVKISAPDFRSAVANEAQQILSSFNLYTDMTFESFDTSSSIKPAERENLERAVRAAYEYAMTLEGWLVLIGPYGTGKTHLAAAIGNFRRKEKGTDVTFITVPDLLDHLRVTFDPGTPVKFDQRFQAVRSAEFLVLDDLGTENTSAWAREKLFQIIDYRYVARLPTVITTANNLETLNERIRSRIQDDRLCRIFALTGTSYAERRKRR